MIVIFTDMDGTLLDKQTYSFDAALPALERIRELGAPLILVTSKTRAEVEHWRGLLGNRDPFIVENGGAAVIPGEATMQWGTPYPALCDALRSVAVETGCRLRGFHQMDTAGIAAVTDLPIEQAELAAQREYDEPFLIEGACDRARLIAAIHARGLLHDEGGRFHHIHGRNDKAIAVRAVTEHYRARFGNVTTIGLGDAPNDLEFLRHVDHAWYSKAGPAGWNEFVLSRLSELAPQGSFRHAV